MSAQTDDLDVLVVGAGQAGLAAGFHLERAGLSYVIHEAHARVGDSWRERYDSLTLFSPRAFDALPGMAMAGDPEGYPGKDEVADYLEAYARAQGLKVACGDGIARLERGVDGEDGFVARTTHGALLGARAVVVATGPFQIPAVPAFAGALGPGVLQLTTTDYRRPGQLPPGHVLVVGDGATGRQIARELAGDREVWLATGRWRPVVPQRSLGQDQMWWGDHLGLLRADKETLRGRLLRANDVIPGWHLRRGALRRAGVHVAPRAVGAAGTEVRFADGSRARVDAVVWAAGYRDRSDWMAVEGAVDERGRFIEDRGVGPVPGLYYVGRSWQNNRTSALLCGVGEEAGGMVEQVRRYLAASR